MGENTDSVLPCSSPLAERAKGERIEEMRKRNTETRFACSCNGCRNYPTFPAQVWHQDQIKSKEQNTYFFRADTMRFFSSRIVDFKPINRGGEIDSLTVIVSSRHGYEGASRYYEVVVLCPYGTIHREGKQFDSLRKARKKWDGVVGAFVPCECHGCVLDREAGE